MEDIRPKEIRLSVQKWREFYIENNLLTHKIKKPQNDSSYNKLIEKQFIKANGSIEPIFQHKPQASSNILDHKTNLTDDLIKLFTTKKISEHNDAQNINNLFCMSNTSWKRTKKIVPQIRNNLSSDVNLRSLSINGSNLAQDSRSRFKQIRRKQHPGFSSFDSIQFQNRINQIEQLDLLEPDSEFEACTIDSFKYEDEDRVQENLFCNINNRIENRSLQSINNIKHINEESEFFQQL